MIKIITCSTYVTDVQLNWPLITSNISNSSVISFKLKVITESNLLGMEPRRGLRHARQWSTTEPPPAQLEGLVTLECSSRS
jgi:hypothetical protein